MATTKRQTKINDTRISRAFTSRCTGIQVNVLDISKVFQVGRAAIANGADDVALGDAIFTFVQTIRKN